MKRLSLILLVAVLIVGAGINSSYAFDQDVQGNSAAIEDLKNFNLLMDLAQIGKATFKASSAISEDNSQKAITGNSITARIETEHAIIYAYENVEIPEFLTSDFDRVFEMVASYLNVEVKNEKMVVWAMDFNTLQEMYPRQDNYPGGSPDTVAALYNPLFNYFFFTPQCLNDYYVAHELTHYFVDEYQEELIAGLPQVITQKNTSGLSLASFVIQHEEEIAIELPRIIIQKNLASFALRGV